MAKQLGFHLDSSACTGCQACVVACKDKNDLPVGISWRRVVSYGGGGWVNQDGFMVPSSVFAYNLSIACNHCENAVCTQVCPTGAMHKGADGIVTINQDECIGCRYCEWACPYTAPQYNEKLGKMTKCNFCQDLLAQGQNPACVDSCVIRALDFGELADLQAKYGTVNAVEPLPAGTITSPSLVITPHKNAQASGKGTGEILGVNGGGL